MAPLEVQLVCKKIYPVFFSPKFLLNISFPFKQMLFKHLKHQCFNLFGELNCILLFFLIILIEKKARKEVNIYWAQYVSDIEIDLILEMGIF